MLKKLEGFAKATFYFLIVVSVIFVVTFKQSTQFISEDVIIHVTGKDQIASVEGAGSTKFIYANNSTYEVADSYIEMTFNSRDTYGRLQVGNTYRVKTRGIRFSFLSMQPNIVKIYEEIQPITYNTTGHVEQVGDTLIFRDGTPAVLPAPHTPAPAPGGVFVIPYPDITE